MPSAFIHYTCYKSHPLDTILKRAFFWDTLLSQKLPNCSKPRLMDWKTSIPLHESKSKWFHSCFSQIATNCEKYFKNSIHKNCGILNSLWQWFPHCAYKGHWAAFSILAMPMFRSTLWLLLHICLQFSVCNKGRLCSIYFCDLVTPLASGRPIFGSPDLRPHIHIPQHSLFFLTHFYFHLLIHMVSYSNSTPLKPLVYGCCCCSFCCCYCSRKSFIVINLIKICIYLWNSMSALMALI